MKRHDPTSRRRRILASFQAALDRPASNRADYLDQIGADDPEMRHEVEALLTASQNGDAARDRDGEGEVYRAGRNDPAPPADESARRQLTVLFCDLVGSTALSQRMDAEDYHALITRYQDEVAALIERHGGHIAQYLGDGILACFGYPAAHDNDAERAVRASYDLVAAIRRLDGAPPDSPLTVRIGAHTGPVVVMPRRPGRAETPMVGETINIAARLQTLAEPNSVLISEATLRLVPGLFVTRDIGTPELKGLSRPLRVHQVIQPSGVRSRLEAMDRLSPLVGRVAEQALLRDRWNMARKGRGQAVLLRGEPGVGKSRLLLDLRRHLAGDAHTWLECGASPLARNSAFQPVIELVVRGLALRDNDSNEEKLRRLERGMATIGLDLPESVALIARLLNIPLPARYAPAPSAHEGRRERTVELLCRWLLGLAQRQPLVLAVEDLHWIDASSLAVLRSLLDRIEDAPLLLLMSTRPEFSAPWSHGWLSTLALPALGDEQAAELVMHVGGGRALPATVQAQVIERAGGVPLFVEELTRALLESGQLIESGAAWQPLEPSVALQIPETLQGSLMARLDRLGPARRLLQSAAVVGREVPLKLLQLLAGLDEVELDRQLDQLIAAGLLYARGSGAETSYLFKHALIQDVACDALLKTARQDLHGRIAELITTHFSERAEAEPQVLAMHCDKAGQVEPAFRHYKRAAENAAAAGALHESMAHCEHALRLLSQLPETAARNRQELDLRLTDGSARMAMLGYSHPTVESTFARAERLCALVDELALRGRALGNIYFMRYGRAELHAALDIGKQLVDLGHRSGVPLLTAVGEVEQGWSLMNLGRLPEARAACEAGLSKFTPAVTQIAYRAFGHDAYTAARLPMVYTLWLLGFPDRALAAAQDTVARAEVQSNPHTVAWALRSTMPVQLFRRQPQDVLRDAARTVELSQQHGFAEWTAFANQFLGVALCMQGRLDEGLAMLRAANAAKQARGTITHRSMFAALEAEQCRLAGRFDEALCAVEEGLAHAERTQERYWEPELHRVRGELHRVTGSRDPDAAEICLRRALLIADGQQGRSLQLRAATSLARLLADTGRRVEGRETLRAVHATFDEGFSTPDLIDAAALLDTLARPPA